MADTFAFNHLLKSPAEPLFLLPTCACTAWGRLVPPTCCATDVAFPGLKRNWPDRGPPL